MMEERVKEVMTKVFGLKQGCIGASTDQEDIPGWDSHGHMLLVTALEEEFGVRFTGEQVFDLLSFSAIVEALRGIL